MNHFLYRLLPPRPDFPADASAAELALMQQHVGYWTEQMNAGRIIVFGPVLDPRGTYGVGILSLQDGQDPEALVRQDPVISANCGFHYEIHPMPQIVYGRR